MLRLDSKTKKIVNTIRITPPARHKPTTTQYTPPLRQATNKCVRPPPRPPQRELKKNPFVYITKLTHSQYYTAIPTCIYVFCKTLRTLTETEATSNKGRVPSSRSIYEICKHNKHTPLIFYSYTYTTYSFAVQTQRAASGKPAFKENPLFFRRMARLFASDFVQTTFLL